MVVPPVKRWTDKDLAELGDFVRLLYAFGGFQTWAEFADAAGVHKVSISRWNNDEMMEGPNLLKLIRASGALAMVQQGVIDRQARLRAAPDPPPGDRLEGLAEKVAYLLDRETDLTERVTRLESGRKRSPNAAKRP